MKSWPLAAAALLAGSAAAQDLRLTPLIDARLRWEQVDQADIPRDAEALTARVRAGTAVDLGPWQALAETEATLAIIEHYNSGSNGLSRYPLVVDPQNVELNRAQLRYRAHGLTATAGRQLVELADQRWVGSSSWRQNQQTFDAARSQWGDPKRLFVDLTYAWSDRTVNGVDGVGARPTAIGGDNVFALAGAHTPAGTLTGFAYLVDQDNAAVQGFRLSSQTYGVRLAGTRRVGPATLVYAASWARQGDWRRNPNRYAAGYWSVEATATLDRLSLTGGHEVLGADDGRALTSVQTPLASFFRFNGWAGRFGTTPPNGLRDLYGTAALAWKKAGPFTGATLSATWHRFRSDRLDQRYGTEWDLLAAVKRGRTALSARYARYRAVDLAIDTDKAWLEADWGF
ncbi:alginate export family protein [Sphingomonas bacterium]|uniref:alginate export family protein n=1 Tax=Sphingomonas bacterium TaxID=1895847 RepID=UPI001576D09A|nr:alginate export family protein [Sphingomonas bacterium]